MHSAKGLPVRVGTADLPPTAFVHYQLMHFPDAFTRAVPETHNPLFEHMERFPIPTNAQMLALLSGGGRMGVNDGGTVLELTVLDDIGEEDADNIGTCRLNLAPLADGDPIYAKLPIVSEAVERTVGSLSVVVRWRHEFRSEKEPGPNALTGRDVSELLSRFSPSKDGQVDWQLFLAWAYPPVIVAHAINCIREYAERVRAAEALTMADLFDHLPTPAAGP